MDIFQARVDVGGLVFRIMWNNTTFMEIYYPTNYSEFDEDYPSDIFGYKFSDVPELTYRNRVFTVSSSNIFFVL